MKRIHWTPAERQLVQEHMTRAIVERNLVSTMDILRAGQAALPSERQRRLSYATVHNCKEMIAEARTQASEQLRNRKLTQLALQKPPAEPVPAPAPAPAELTLGNLFERLVEELTRRVVAEVRAALAEPRPAAVEPQIVRLRPRHDPSPPSVERQPRLGVLVIGLLNDQINALPVFNTLDLTFMQAEEAVTRAPVRRAYTVLMTKFINHAVQDKYRKANNLRYCNGGTSELIKLLMGIAITEDKNASAATQVRHS